MYRNILQNMLLFVRRAGIFLKLLLFLFAVLTVFGLLLIFPKILLKRACKTAAIVV